LKRIIDDQHARLGEAQEKLSKVVNKQSGLVNRTNHAMHRHNLLEQRLHCLRNLPGAHKKPLSKAEREFKSELGNQFYAYSNYFNEIMQISVHISDFAHPLPFHEGNKKFPFCGQMLFLYLYHTTVLVGF
jgi:hypothetical protein